MELVHHLKDVPPFGWLGGTIIAVTVLGYLFKGVRFLYTQSIRLADFLDDWQGEPARPGFDARPGVLERVKRLEQQLQTNGGTSLRDQTNRIEARLNEHIAASSDIKH